MNLLLDTHIFLWAIEDHPNLTEPARNAIIDGRNVVFVSAATAWEIAIKRGLGKLDVPQGDYLGELHAHRFTPLDIKTEHTLAVEFLPMHHKDPFDRLLIAQAQIEKLTLVTRDPKIMAYDVSVIAS
ncbi:MAG: type II toxin-antitoxin system VapC family toxin [Chloroflexota bacterium]